MRKCLESSGSEMIGLPSLFCHGRSCFLPPCFPFFFYLSIKTFFKTIHSSATAVAKKRFRAFGEPRHPRHPVWAPGSVPFFGPQNQCPFWLQKMGTDFGYQKWVPISVTENGYRFWYPKWVPIRYPKLVTIFDPKIGYHF